MILLFYFSKKTEYNIGFVLLEHAITVVTTELWELVHVCGLALSTFKSYLYIRLGCIKMISTDHDSIITEVRRLW